MILNCAGRLLSTNSSLIMGILNVTPDSFYDGGVNNSLHTLHNHVSKMVNEGADIIDVGGMSSRPGAKIVSSTDEWSRIHKTMKFLKLEFPEVTVSVDTIHAETAVKALDLGAHIVNDISGGRYDDKMYQAISSYQPAYVMMHMRGTPSNMQNDVTYGNLTLELITYFKNQISIAQKAGLTDIIIDPGFGFSKTIDQNFHLLNDLSVLRIVSKNILVGVSRKSLIYKTLGLSPKEALNGTSVLHLKALQEGAKILRVHDVKEAKETINLFEKLSVNK